MNPINIVLFENIHPVAKQMLEEQNFNVELLSTALSEKDLIDRISSNVHGIGIRSKSQITAKVLESAQNLMLCCNFCIGTNQVDLNKANELGIPVFNAPYSNTRSVAELVIAEVISLSRRIAHISRLAHKGQWQKSATNSHEIRGKTLGIVGYGHIGSQVSVLAEAMGLQVMFYDVIKKLPLGNSTACNSLEEVLQSSDFISLHVPETPQTKNMISAKQLKQMKKGSYLINASRGSVVAIEDLVSALKEEHLYGAAIDVFPVEPKNNNEKFTSPLQDIDNVILTPHIGGSTEEAQEAIGKEVATSLIQYINKGSTLGAVNFPQVDLPNTRNSQRVINVHKNIPGVLSEINKIVSDIGANITGQALSTDSNIGYLIMDVEQGEADQLSERIRQLETSIKTRFINS